MRSFLLLVCLACCCVLLASPALALNVYDPFNPTAKDVPAARDPEAGPVVASGVSLNLEETVAAALAAYPSIEAAERSIRTAEEGRKSAQAAFLPRLSGGYSFTHNGNPTELSGEQVSADNTFSLYFQITQPIFTGFRNPEALAKTQLQKEYAKANLSNEELSLVLTVQETFLQLLAARENRRSAEGSVTRLKSQLDVTQAFFDVGLRPRFDVLQAEVDLADAEDLLLQAENDITTLETRLNTLLMLSHDDTVEYLGELAYTPFELSLEDCLQLAMLQRPDLTLARKNVEIAYKDAGIAKSSIYPQVSADMQWQSTGDSPLVSGDEFNDSDYSSWSASVDANWEIFDFGENWYGYTQANEDAARLQAVEKQIRTDVVFDVKSKFLKIDEAEKRIRVARKALESAKEGYRMAVARYQAQVGTNTDVLDAQESLTRAEANLTSALSDYQIALANMYVAVGKKNPSLMPH